MIEEPTPRRTVLEHPQPLGLLPTRRFWRDPEASQPVRGPLAILAGVIVFITATLGLHWLVAGALAAVAVALVQGLLERYGRKRLARVRRGPDALVVPD